jgi:hypothetical protein
MYTALGLRMYTQNLDDQAWEARIRAVFLLSRSSLALPSVVTLNHSFSHIHDCFLIIVCVARRASTKFSRQFLTVLLKKVLFYSVPAKRTELKLKN